MNDDIQLDLLVIEDEEFMREDLRIHLEEQLRDVSQPGFFDNVVAQADLAGILVNQCVHCTDNLQDATRLVSDGHCDVILADYMVKETEHGRKGGTSAIPFLRQTRQRRPFIPIIEHTAFAHLHQEAAKGNLALKTHSKRERNSLLEVVRSAVAVSKEIALFRAPIAAAFSALKHAAETESPVEKQEYIGRARALLTKLILPQFIPDEYRRTLVLITNCVIRLSSVPSARYRLQPISSDSVSVAAPIFRALRGASLNYEKDVLPVVLRLEALGFPVRMSLGSEV